MSLLQSGGRGRIEKGTHLQWLRGWEDFDVLDSYGFVRYVWVVKFSEGSCVKLEYGNEKYGKG